MVDNMNMSHAIDLQTLMAHISSSVAQQVTAYAADGRHQTILERALLIRAVESVLLDLFGRGKLHGTIHTCVGQELTGAIIGSKMRDGDFVTSNHRGHGHFIGATENWRGLIDEVVGNRDGVCAGIGGSQHLFSNNFIANGPQGSLLPVAAGIALDCKRRAKDGVVVSFIGEGTLGEGVVYETLNMDSLWNLPHLIVCENNFYSQSTPQRLGVAGDIAGRAAAFGITVRESDTWNPDELDALASESLDFVRTHGRPMFLLIRTYRLNAHSKGDDDRSVDEIRWFREHDPLTILLNEEGSYRTHYQEILREVEDYANLAVGKPKLSKDAYLVNQLPKRENRSWRKAPSGPHNLRFGDQLNRFYADYLRANERAYFLGEDIGDPYGGAFKISRGLQSAFPDRVITSPISEAALTGVGAGLALAGNRPLVEIMFGDFITLAFDQIVNNASKFFYMYHGGVSCPIVIRTPVGGRRGYGPTHSQSLERFLIGIDNCVTLSLNSLSEAGTQLSRLSSLQCPALLLENKVDYTLRTFQPPEGYVVEVGDAEFPTVLVKPQRSLATMTIVAYGGIARLVADNLLEIFEATDFLPALVVPMMIYPLDIGPVAQSVEQTRRLAVIEEGSSFASVGSEIITQVVERLGPISFVLRLGGPGAPVPAEPELEESVLPNISQICSALRSLQGV